MIDIDFVPTDLEWCYMFTLSNVLIDHENVLNKIDDSEKEKVEPFFLFYCLFAKIQ